MNVSIKNAVRHLNAFKILQIACQDENEQGGKPDEFSGSAGGELEGFRRQPEHIPVL